MINTETFDTLFDRHAVASFDKQAFFEELIGGPDVAWNLDLPEGVVRFESGLAFPGQLLGTEMGDTWRWAWAAAEDSEIPDSLLGSARALRKLGEAMGIEELTRPELSVLEVNGTLASLLAVGMLGANAYARGAFDGGAVYALVASPRFPANVVDPLSRVSEIFPRAARELAFNHRRGFLTYLEHYSLAYRQDESRPEALVYEVNGHDGEAGVTATFSHLGRLTAFQGTVDSLVGDAR